MESLKSAKKILIFSDPNPSGIGTDQPQRICKYDLTSLINDSIALDQIRIPRDDRIDSNPQRSGNEQTNQSKTKAGSHPPLRLPEQQQNAYQHHCREETENPHARQRKNQ